MAKKTVELYPFAPGFEPHVIFHTCTNPAFYGRVGHALDPEAMPSEVGQLAVKASHEIATDLGHGPKDGLQVLQRLRRWMDDGKLKHAQLQALVDMFEAVEDAGSLPIEGVVTELTPLLQQRLRHEAVKTAMAEYAAKGDFSKVVSITEKANRLGVQDVSIGTRVGASAFVTIESVRSIDRLPTGIPELDAALARGMPRGQLGVFLGGPGDGKSMALNHVAGAAWKAGLFVGYASLELPEHIVLARLVANVTGLSIDSIVDGNDEAKRLIERIPGGACIVKPFTPQATTVDDVTNWVKQCEDAEGRKMDVLLVDYADKLTMRLKKQKKDENPYSTYELIYEGLRLHADARKSWTWTASQATRRGKGDKKRLADLDDVADSMGKVRVADLVVTLNARDEGANMEYLVAKNRTGVSRIRVGPVPVDFKTGSMTIRLPMEETMQQVEAW